ncbi:MAG TPA: hypothetical protein DEU95_08940, partial [Chloroflexi bacterium]|nr:hypothetical protein [Chloroflexota bacterium]
VMATEPIALQLRFLQTLTEIATEKNSTILFPVPVDLISAFMNLSQSGTLANLARVVEHQAESES